MGPFTGFSLPNAIPIPEELWDLLPGMGEAELKVTLFLLYKTLGFRKREDAVSLSQIIAGTGLSRAAITRAIARLQEKGVVDVVRSISPEGDRNINVYRPRFRPEGGSIQSIPPPDTKYTGGSSPGIPGSIQSEPTCIAAATAAEEEQFFRFFLNLTEQQPREPQSDEIDEIRRLLQEGIPQETILDGIRQAVASRRQDQALTIARCAKIIRRLHRRRTREGTPPAPPTGRAAGTASSDTADGTIGAAEPRSDRPYPEAVPPAADALAANRAAALSASPAGPEDDFRDIWAMLQEAGMDTPVLRRSIRHLAEQYAPEAVYRAVLEALTYGISPQRLVGYVRAVLRRMAEDAGDARDTGAVAEGAGPPPSGVVGGNGAGPPDGADPLWQAALAELQLQLTRATFDNRLQGTHLIACEDGVFVVGVPDEYTRAWLEARLKVVVERVLARLTGSEAEVRFVVEGADGAVPAQ